MKTINRYAEIERIVEQRLGCSAHKLDHIYRVYDLCILIGECEEHVDMDVLLPAALLHDIARSEESKDITGTIDHALLGGEMAAELLFEPVMLDAQRLVLDLIRALRPLCAQLALHSPDLADQLRRSVSSVALNLGEGVRRTGRDKKRAYRIAAAEAQEAKVTLEVALAWGWLDEPDVATVRTLADRIARVTYALAR
jgi:four helix bundle protein